MTTYSPTQNFRPIPHRPDRILFLHDLPAFLRDTVQFWRDTAHYGDVVELRFGPRRSYLISSADFAQQLLQKNNRNYIKEPRLVKVVEQGGAPSLFSTDGDEWLWRRRLMQPSFHRKQIASFGEAIESEADRFLSRWADEETRNIEEEMKALTMHIIGRTMFSVDMAGDSADLHHAYELLSQSFNDRLLSIIDYPAWVPTRANRQLKEANQIITKKLTAILQERRQTKEPKHDLLEMLMSAEENGHQFTPSQLLIEMSAIVFAGHETTALTLTWLFYLLAQHPEVEQRLLEEYAQQLGGRSPKIEEIAQLPYTTQVINEAMRLYPAAIVISRQLLEAESFGNHLLPAKANIVLNIGALHRDPRHWEHPDHFYPDHFAPSASAERHKFAFIPFSGGPRKCIGEPLAMAEMQLLLPTILQRYRLRLADGWRTRPKMKFTLVPESKMMMRIERRDRA